MRGVKVLVPSLREKRILNNFPQNWGHNKNAWSKETDGDTEKLSHQWLVLAGRQRPGTWDLHLWPRQGSCGTGVPGGVADSTQTPGLPALGCPREPRGLGAP